MSEIVAGEIRAGRGNRLRCRGWRQEALLRLLENTLEVAERPDDLVIYAAHAKVARDHESLARIIDALKRLGDAETLVVQSGKPIAVFPTHERAPAVVMANGNLVGRWATPEHFYAHEEQGLLAWGGLTAGAWQYIGSQGVIQGTYETFAAVAREHFDGTLAGRLVVSAGLGGMSAAQPLAVARMLGGVLLCAEVDGEKLERRRAAGHLERTTADVDEAIAWGRASAAQGQAISIGVHANTVDVLEALVLSGLTPDVVTDLTAAHDLRHGYVPVGTDLAEAARLRESDPAQLMERGRQGIRRHVAAMLALRERGAVVFDYGNNIRPQAAEAGLPEALTIDVFTTRYLRPLFCRGVGPFRWICLSGEQDDQAVLDDLCAELFADEPRVTTWIDLARRHIPNQGLPARIAWLGNGERARFAVAANAAVADGRLSAPVAFTRDHMDPGAMAHPYIITEAMRDGSDAVADWPLLNAMLLTASMADLVAVHAGGGGYAGYSLSAGVTVVADGSDAADERLGRTLSADTGLGVLRHADAGYEDAIDEARRTGLGLHHDERQAG